MLSRLLSVACLALTLVACGEGGDIIGGDPPPSSGCTSSSCGTAYISLMDADGDFLSYTVDVAALTLKKADGSGVEVLSVKPRVDFADLSALKEFVTAATIPNGVYTSGTLRLDFTNSDIVVDVNGVPTRAVPVDASGAALTTVDLDIQLDNRKQLTIASATPSLLELDFNLLASNTIDLTKNPVQVAVQPFVVASVGLVDNREARVRGLLKSVTTASGDFKMDLRPFRLTSGRLGEVTVHTTAQTQFEIDGVASTGSLGVAALAALANDSPVSAFGTLDANQRTFTALRVYGGSSVASSQFDIVEGNVVARSGSSLTVRGATLIKRDGSVTFKRGTTTLTVGPNTKVTKDGVPDPTLSLTNADISVGQRIYAFGSATEGANNDATLDATSGRVRMQLTHVLGTVNAFPRPGWVALDLASIDGHPASVFDFTGTGFQPVLDAVASAYEVNTDPLDDVPLDIGDLDIGSAARFFGFVGPFGGAPPDFEARTVVDVSDVRAVLAVSYGLTGTNAPFLSIDATAGLVINQNNSRIGARRFITVGADVFDITDLSSSVSITPDTGTFAIGEPRRVEVFTNFGDFVTRLNAKLLAQRVISITATGSYDEASNMLSANRVLVEMTAN